MGTRLALPAPREGLARAILRAWRAERVILLVALVGLTLRLWQIGGQILADDEWHALYALTFRGYGNVLTHFGMSDYSIPLTLFYKGLAETVGLTELAVRAPVLASGIASIVVLPLLLRRHVGRPAADGLGWLLAVAPLHVYFSRYARPYGITLLLAAVAVVAFFRWASGGRRRWALVYVACAVMAPWFHLSVLPAVLAPIVFGTAERLLRRGREGGPTLLGVAAAGGAVTAGLAFLLVAPFLLDSAALATKAGTGAVRWETLKGTARLVTGTARPWLVVAMLALIVTGWAMLARRCSRFSLYLLVVAICEVIALFLARPHAVEEPIVFARYLLPLLPFVLLGAAAGITAIEGVASRRLATYPAGWLPPVVAGLLLALGPIPAVYRYPNDWTNHAVFQYEYDEGAPYSCAPLVRPHRIPPFYERLASVPPGTLRIVEAPWYYTWDRNPYPFYQAIHRQRMLVGLVAPRNRFVREGELPRASGVRLRNTFHVRDAAERRDPRVRYVVFHLRLHKEFPRGSSEIVDVSEWLDWYRRRVGAPVYEDSDVVVFDVGPRCDP